MTISQMTLPERALICSRESVELRIEPSGTPALIRHSSKYYLSRILETICY